MDKHYDNHVYVLYQQGDYCVKQVVGVYETYGEALKAIEATPNSELFTWIVEFDGTPPIIGTTG